MAKECLSSKRWNALFVFSQGFSLIELLVTLGLLSLLLAVVTPSFSSLLSQVQTDNDVASIRRALSFSRMTALSKRKKVIACRWDGNSGCTGNSGIGTLEWPVGIFIYLDQNNDKVWDPTADQALRVVPFTQRNTIRWNNGEKVIFQPDGSSPGYNGTFFLSQNGRVVAKLVLSMTGRLRNGMDL